MRLFILLVLGFIHSFCFAWDDIAHFPVKLREEKSTPLISLRSHIHLMSEIEEFRADEDSIGKLDFTFTRLDLMSNLENGESPLSMQFQMGIMGMSKNDLGNSEVSTFRGRFMGSVANTLVYELAYSFLRSPKFNLIANHQELGASLGYLAVNKESSLIIGTLFLAKGFLPFAIEDNVNSKYTAQWGASARIFIGQNNEFSWRAESALEFRNSPEMRSQNELLSPTLFLSSTTSVDCLLLDDYDLWFGASFSKAIIQRENREFVFGDLEIPGLLGSSFGFKISMSIY